MTLISAIFTVLTVIIGGVCTMLYVSTATLRASRDDMEVRITQLEAERTRDKALIASQRAEIEIWRKTVTGEAQLAEISALLNKHHDEAVRKWTQMSVSLGHVGRVLDKTLESIDRLVALGGKP